jgi:ABC-type phosphate transport system substrate-binding protein
LITKKKREEMKILMMVMAIVAMMFFVGCESGMGDEEGDTSSEDTNITIDGSDVEINQMIEYNYYEYDTNEFTEADEELEEEE